MVHPSALLLVMGARFASCRREMGGRAVPPGVLPEPLSNEPLPIASPFAAVDVAAVEEDVLVRCDAVVVVIELLRPDELLAVEDPEFEDAVPPVDEVVEDVFDPEADPIVKPAELPAVVPPAAEPEVEPPAIIPDAVVVVAVPVAPDCEHSPCL